MDVLFFALPVTLVAVGYLLPGLTSPNTDGASGSAVARGSKSPCQAC